MPTQDQTKNGVLLPGRALFLSCTRFHGSTPHTPYTSLTTQFVRIYPTFQEPHPYYHGLFRPFHPTLVLPFFEPTDTVPQTRNKRCRVSQCICVVSMFYDFRSVYLTINIGLRWVHGLLIQKWSCRCLSYLSTSGQGLGTIGSYGSWVVPIPRRLSTTPPSNLTSTIGWSTPRSSTFDRNSYSRRNLKRGFLRANGVGSGRDSERLVVLRYGKRSCLSGLL